MLSKRGGASGAGVNLFSRGGVVWDGGHPATPGPSVLALRQPKTNGHTTDACPLGISKHVAYRIDAASRQDCGWGVRT